MNKERRFLNTALILTSIVALTMTALYFSQLKQNSPIIKTVPSDSDDRMFEGMLSDNSSIQRSNLLVSPDKQPVMLGELLQEDVPYVILRFSNQCSKNEISDLVRRMETLRSRISCIRLIIIASGMNYRDMKVKFSGVTHNIPAYAMESKTLGLPLDHSIAPYLTFINDGKIAKHVLPLIDIQPYMLDRYINFINSRYCISEENK